MLWDQWLLLPLDKPPTCPAQYGVCTHGGMARDQGTGHLSLSSPPRFPHPTATHPWRAPIQTTTL